MGTERENHQEAYPVPAFAENETMVRPLSLRLTGYYGRLYNHNTPARIINEYVVILCTEGEGWVELDGGPRQSVHPEEILFLPAGVLQSYGSVPGGCWSLLWLHCSGEDVRYFYNYIREKQKEASRRIAMPAPSGAYFYLNQILKIGKSLNSYLDLLQAETLLYQLFAALSRSSFGKVADFNEELVQNVTEWMKTTDRYDFSLDEIAAQFGVSKFHLIRMFKRYADTPPMEYWQNLRMKRSCTMLSAGNCSIKEISERLGYSNPYHFSKMFKQHFGISPSDFKKLL